MVRNKLNHGLGIGLKIILVTTLKKSFSKPGFSILNTEIDISITVTALCIAYSKQIEPEGREGMSLAVLL